MYFRFRSWQFQRNRRNILDQGAKFRPNRSIRRGIWRYIDFQDGGCQPCCVCFGLMVDHTRSAFHGLISVLKSLIGRINNSGYISNFGLKLPIYVPFWEFCGTFFPHDVTHRPDPKRTILGRKHVIWAIQRKNQSNNSSWARGEAKKDRSTKYSQKCYNSPIWRESPVDRFDPKVAWWVMTMT